MSLGQVYAVLGVELKALKLKALLVPVRQAVDQLSRVFALCL